MKELVRKHGDRRDNNGKRQRPPEATSKVCQFRIVFVFQFRNEWLKTHSAFRAVAWMVLANFWMHRASINRACYCRRCNLFNLGLKISSGLSAELVHAARTAEMINLAGMLVFLLRNGGYFQPY